MTRAAKPKPKRSRARGKPQEPAKPKTAPTPEPPPPPPTPEPARPLKSARIRHCMALMATGKWIPALTAVELSKLWHLHVRVVEGDAAEASRRIRDGIMLDDDLRGTVIATLQGIAATSQDIAEAALKGRTQPRTAIEALRTKLEAVKAMAAVAGVEKPKKVEVGGSLSELIALAHSSPDGSGPKAD